MALWHLEGSLDETETIKKVPITKFPFVIGRNKSIDMVVLRSGISREHAEIINRDGRLYIRDLQSTNGTFVNKERINSDVLLTHNTSIHFAKFEFVLIDSEYRASDDDMLTVVMSLDDAIGLQDKLRDDQRRKASPSVASKKLNPAERPVHEIDSPKTPIEDQGNVNDVEDNSASAPSPESVSDPDVEQLPSSNGLGDKVFIQGTWDEANRRLHTRREVRWQAFITLKSQQTVQCVTKDISESGIAIMSPVKLNKMDLVKLDINVFYKGRSRDVSVLGVVKHSLIKNDGFVVGILIKSCSKQCREFITKFSNRTI